LEASELIAIFLKIAVPQKDLSVTIDGFRITPPMGLTSWVAFTPAKGRTMLMGDIVLLENEIGPVQKVVVQYDMTVTGLHNHFLRDKPKVMFMHVLGHDVTGRLAKGVRAMLDTVKELRGVPPAAMETEPVVNEIDTERIESILGHTGEMSGGVFKITIDRPDVSLKDHGVPVSNLLGFNTWAAFQGTADKAAVAGDFAMQQDEVALVTRTLIDRGIEVVAMHNHMVTEEPRIVFLHYWAVGPAEQLAQPLKDALGTLAQTAEQRCFLLCKISGIAELISF
jgi:hypothetical protein